ncbi:hypothetical protein ASPNIDRAFT_178085 [Aspergillus niger ATCC 1015]|uniref:NADH:ubiquinone reductase (non-electrogenic) n=1 Tax=Aspergillus niger (strain ATCC 1015 / CBS 113.46 / FGSC A1144 / LSHB Ac4 / NCTC 3858a / NRRL 328 / USDA 3528.7) TaxID=380704 RepID=G3YB37_ASPNA|nr:hypothetical protein ASPNIDRAFT_178085 [Aspergillus niger ATCC 1015]
MLARLNQHYLTTKHPEKPTSCRTISSGNLRTPRVIKTIALAIGGVAAYGAYCIFRRPDSRAIVEADPSKKTLVVLGTGWGSVSLLKHLDTSRYNVLVISPRDHFLFTPLLPSCAIGMLEGRSLTEPIRRILSKEHGSVKFCKASVSKIDYANRVVHINSNDKVSFDLLVVGIGAENATFGIPGVKEHACFLKELEDAREIRQRVINCIEQASQEQNDTELERKLHMVVVGGGPTGIETAAEMRDFFRNDVQRLFPKLSDKVKVTLVEALPSVLQMFPKGLIEYTESKFLAEQIDILKNTKVKRATETHIEAEVTQPDGSIKTEMVPYGVLVWAAGNAVRPVVRDLMDQLPEQASSRRGLLVDEYLRVKGTQGVWALGDCTATRYSATGQVAHQEGAYLAQFLNNADANAGEDMARSQLPPPFEYTHQGSLAYVGDGCAIADLSVFGKNMPFAGALTHILWRIAYIKMCISSRNQYFIAGDWLGPAIFGRSMSTN